MNIPVELIAVCFGGIIALQGWTLREIVAIKVKLGGYEDLKKRVEYLENRKH